MSSVYTGEVHVVEANDGLSSLWDISEHYGVSWEELLKENPQFKDRKPEYWINSGDRVALPKKRWSKLKIKDCKSGCSIYYFLVIKINLANGKANNGTPMGGYALPLDQYETNVEFFCGFDDGSYRAKKVSQVDGVGEYVRGQREPLMRVISKDTFDRLKRVIIWAPDMNASFWKSKLHDGYAVGRIDVPRHRMTVEDVAQHPVLGHVLPKGSKKLVVEVDILEHPAQYILREMVRNARGGDVPTDESYDGPGFILLGSRWGLKASNGRDWDYKAEHRVGGVWGNWIRLGNDKDAVHNEAFSNYHYGYVGAAGGLTLADTLKISELGGWVAESRDTEADVYAMIEGHTRFLRDQGKNKETPAVIWVKEREVKTYVSLSSGGNTFQLPVSVPTGKSKLVDLSREKKRSSMEKKSPDSSFLLLVYEGYDYRYTKQLMKKDPSFQSVTTFLRAYLEAHPTKL